MTLDVILGDFEGDPEWPYWWPKWQNYRSSIDHQIHILNRYQISGQLVQLFLRYHWVSRILETLWIMSWSAFKTNYFPWISVNQKAFDIEKHRSVCVFVCTFSRCICIKAAISCIWFENKWTRRAFEMKLLNVTMYCKIFWVW